MDCCLEGEGEESGEGEHAETDETDEREGVREPQGEAAEEAGRELQSRFRE